ncbi:hypothetical protein ACFC60_10140 [Kitasatospora purpeofusca]|uniref:hypothetical protein n=1 Tax=Kitasatospora purpeofusca TaxID=67352 RepID=UPI0035DDB2D3
MRELGERILAEFGEDHTNNTLIRWMAHHTAGLVEAADRAREAGDADADAHAAMAREAILQLWQARSAWPSGWPPPGAAEIVRLLDALPDPGSATWHRPTVLAQLHDLHHRILGAIVDLATQGGAVDVEQGWLDAFSDRLTPDEAVLLRRVATRAGRIDILSRWAIRHGTDEAALGPNDHGEGETGGTTSAHPLVQLADAYRDTILNLFDKSHDSAGDDDASDPNDPRDRETSARNGT